MIAHQSVATSVTKTTDLQNILKPSYELIASLIHDSWKWWAKKELQQTGRQISYLIRKHWNDLRIPFKSLPNTDKLRYQKFAQEIIDSIEKKAKKDGLIEECAGFVEAWQEQGLITEGMNNELFFQEQRALQKELRGHFQTLRNTELSFKEKREMQKQVKSLFQQLGVESKDEEKNKSEEAKQEAIHALKNDVIYQGLAITTELLNKKVVSFLGKKIASPKKLAGIAQMARDPRFETLRYIFLKNNIVVGHISLSCRIPDIARVFPDGEDINWLTTQLKKHHADGFYLMHNHPSGNSAPSPEDINFTKMIGNIYNSEYPFLKGHLVINHQEYSLISPKGKVTTHNLEKNKTKETKDLLLTPSIEHSLLGKKITSIVDVVNGFDELREKSDDFFTVIGCDAKLKIRAITELPIAYWMDTKESRFSLVDSLQ